MTYKQFLDQKDGLIYKNLEQLIINGSKLSIAKVRNTLTKDFMYLAIENGKVGSMIRTDVQMDLELIHKDLMAGENLNEIINKTHEVTI